MYFDNSLSFNLFAFSPFFLKVVHALFINTQFTFASWAILLPLNIQFTDEI